MLHRFSLFSSQPSLRIPTDIEPIWHNYKVQQLRGEANMPRTYQKYPCYFFQTMSISMYFGVSWLDPRLQINASAKEWTEVKTGPKNVSCFFNLGSINHLRLAICLNDKYFIGLRQGLQINHSKGFPFLFINCNASYILSTVVSSYQTWVIQFKNLLSCNYNNIVFKHNCLPLIQAGMTQITNINTIILSLNDNFH